MRSSSTPYLAQAEAAYQAAARFTLILRPATNNPKLLLKALERIHATFQFLFQSSENQSNNTSKLTAEQLITRFLKGAHTYGLIDKDKETLQRIVFLHKTYTQSVLDFSKNGKAIMLNAQGEPIELTVQDILAALHIAKKIIIRLKSQASPPRKV